MLNRRGNPCPATYYGGALQMKRVASHAIISLLTMAVDRPCICGRGGGKKSKKKRVLCDEDVKMSKFLSKRPIKV